MARSKALDPSLPFGSRSANDWRGETLCDGSTLNRTRPRTRYALPQPRANLDRAAWARGDPLPRFPTVGTDASR